MSDGDVDYAQLVKLYGAPDHPGTTPRRSSSGFIPRRSTASPRPKISRSYGKAPEPDDAMSVRRFTRLTNGASEELLLLPPE